VSPKPSSKGLSLHEHRYMAYYDNKTTIIDMPSHDAIGQNNKYSVIIPSSFSPPPSLAFLFSRSAASF
jgi:hypothetical protein